MSQLLSWHVSETSRTRQMGAHTYDHIWGCHVNANIANMLEGSSLHTWRRQMHYNNMLDVP